MKVPIGILIILSLGFTRSFGSFNRADSVVCDTGHLTLIIDCLPTLDGIPLHDNDLIVASMRSDTVEVSDTLTYAALSDNIIALPVINLELTDGTINNLDFSIFSTTASCQTLKVEYHISDSLSNSCYMVIDELNASAYSVSYPSDMFCLGIDSIFPVTDVPGNAVLYVADSLPCMNDEGAIIPGYCQSGRYTIHFNSEYCLSEDYFDLSLLDWVETDLPDTLSICSGTSLNDGGILTGYSIYTPGSYDAIDSNEIPSDGYYVVSSDNGQCTVPDTVYFHIDDPPLIDFSLREECDHVVVALENMQRGTENLGWTNGENSNEVEVFNDQSLGVSLMDESGCVATDSIYVDVKVIEFPAVQFQKEDATCWLEGNIHIESVQVNNNVGMLKYRVQNTLNGITYDDLEDIPEGQYNLEVVDDRECMATYNEPITITQRCLEDYPVFTPNGDAVEDTYFIPYEGSVQIFDVNGTLIRRLNTPAYWDGTDDSDNPLPMGTYAIITDSGKIVNITIIK